MKNKAKRISKAKHFLFKNRVHRFLPDGNKINFLGHLSTLSRWISNQKNLDYSTFPVKKFDYKQRLVLFQHIIDTEIKSEDIDYLEFGVSTGNSFRWWAENIKNENSSFYGFDTFTGLPEDWGPYKKGDMSNGNAPPEIDDPRCTFYQGIFQSTLYDFLKSYEVGKKKVIHLDADLYTATLFVLTTLSPYLRKGDILLFDEFNVPLHEYKAFMDWVNSFYIDYSVIGEVNNFYQVAIKLN